MDKEENSRVVAFVAVVEPFITLDYQEVQRAKVDGLSIDLNSRLTGNAYVEFVVLC